MRHSIEPTKTTTFWSAALGAKTSKMWIAAGVGSQVVQWFEACFVEDPRLLAPANPARARIDWALGRLVAVGVAEAHDLERRVTAAAEAPAVAPVRHKPD